MLFLKKLIGFILFFINNNIEKMSEVNVLHFFNYRVAIILFSWLGIGSQLGVSGSD